MYKIIYPPMKQQINPLLTTILAQINENGGVNSTLIAIEKEWKHEIIGRSNHRAWSQDEFTSLRTQIQNGIVYPTIEGRSKSAIQNAINKIKRRDALSKGRTNWSITETAYLKKCVTMGIRPNVIGRSDEAILRKLGRLSLSAEGLGISYKRKNK